MRVAGLEALSHGALDLAEVGEDALAQRGYDPRRHVAHSALDGCLLLQLSDLVWHDGGHAVLAERLVGLVERDLAFARMLDDAGFEVVALQNASDTTEMLAGIDVRRCPTFLIHGEKCLHVSISAVR